MQLELTSEIIINASSEEIWNELIDFNSYPEWNPFISSIQGNPEKGNCLKANIDGMKFSPIILESIPNNKLVWLGKLGIKGVFDGKHSFEIISQDKACLFVQSEIFTGLLVPLFKKKLNKDTKEGFIKMNQALKARIEKN